MATKEAYPWWRESKKCWYVWHGGRQERLSPDKGTAFRMWHELKAGEVAGGRDARRVSVIVAAYLEAMGSLLKPSTMIYKRVILNRLVRERGTHPFDGEIRGWIDKAEWGQSTRWAVCSMLKRVATWCVGEGLIGEDPLKGWRVAGCKARGEEAAIPPEVHRKMIDGAPPCYQDALTFLYETGCRPGEMCALTAADVDIGRQVAILKGHKTDTKTGRPRVIVLPDTLLPLVSRLMGRHREGRLFRNTNGDPLTPERLWNWFNRRRDRLGLPKAFPYGYRHALATDTLAAGVPDSHVAALLGHSSTSTLHKHYNHLISKVQTLKDAVNRARPNG